MKIETPKPEMFEMRIAKNPGKFIKFSFKGWEYGIESLLKGFEDNENHCIIKMDLNQLKFLINCVEGYITGESNKMSLSELDKKVEKIERDIRILNEIHFGE